MSLLPFDEVGNLSSNLKTETHTVAAINGVNLNYIVPDWAPFHKTGFAIYHVEGARYLEPDNDFIFTHHFEAADDYIATKVYGSITLLDTGITGTFEISLQSIGGDLVSNVTQAVESGYNTLANLLTVTWDALPDVPTTFPPTEHNHTISGIEGAVEIEASLNLIRDAITAQFTSLTLADITDLQTAALDPLLTAIGNLTAAIVSNGFNSNLANYSAKQSGALLDLGAVTATWIDLPLSITVTASGTYLVDWSIPNDTDGEGLEVRYLVDNVALEESYLKHYPLAIPAGSDLKIQARFRDEDSTYFNIASVTTGSTFNAVRIGN